MSKAAIASPDVTAPALVLIGGGAASGKSTICAALARRIASAVLLDKDLLFAPWVDALMAAQGLPSDRDCPFYWQTLRPMEYAALERAAFHQLRLRKVVIVDAPLRPELDDPAWVRRLAGQCSGLGAGFLAAWIEISPPRARERITKRGQARDRWKIDNWDEFLRRQPYGAPRAAQLVLPNDKDSSVESLVATIMSKITASPQKDVPKPLHA